MSLICIVGFVYGADDKRVADDKCVEVGADAGTGTGTDTQTQYTDTDTDTLNTIFRVLHASTPCE